MYFWYRTRKRIVITRTVIWNNKILKKKRGRLKDMKLRKLSTTSGMKLKSLKMLRIEEFSVKRSHLHWPQFLNFFFIDKAELSKKLKKKSGQGWKGFDLNGRKCKTSWRQHFKHECAADGQVWIWIENFFGDFWLLWMNFVRKQQLVVIHSNSSWK